MNDDNDDLELRNRKKKKKQTMPTTDDENKSHDDIHGLMTYYEMLTRLYSLMPRKTTHKAIIAVPQVQAIGSRRSSITNFKQLCKSIGRDIMEIKKYIECELNTTTSLNNQSELICRGRYTSADIQSLIRQYIKSNVECKTCHSINTTYYRDSNHLKILDCIDCHASSSLPKMK